MATTTPPLLSFNRGIISKTTMARTDLDRTRLSAEDMTNWLPKTQGPMIMRPGTKYSGSSLNDTGAFWIEFVASTDDLALLEMTAGKMRVWLPSDTGNDWETPAQAGVFVPMSRPAVDTTVSLADTGWINASLGGFAIQGQVDLVPTMSTYTNGNITVSASSENAVNSTNPQSNGPVWHAFDDNFADSGSRWVDTGPTGSTLPSWVNVDFGADTGDWKAVTSYSMRSAKVSFELDNAPNTWRVLGSNYDTGSYATDTGKWTLEDEVTGETGWSAVEKRTFTCDTGVGTFRHWRFYFTAMDGDTETAISEIELFDNAATQPVNFSSGELILNAGGIGSTAVAKKKVVVDTGDLGIEHSLNMKVGRGPVTLRVGSGDGDDDYVSETALGTGYHNLAFTPNSDFHITIKTDESVNRVVESLSVSDTGTVEIATPWGYGNLSDIRYDQSADVIYANCLGVKQQKIERRGTGRSWSVVNYEPSSGPFLQARSSAARLSVSGRYGNVTMTSDIPFFRSTQVGSLFKVTHNGQSGEYVLGNSDAATDVIEVTGIHKANSDTDERRITFAVAGSYSGEITIERSFDGPDFGFRKVIGSMVTSGSNDDTGTFTSVVDDTDDNITVWYRARMSDYTSGAAVVNVTYLNGSVTGRARVTSFNNSQSVDIEVLQNFSDTGESSEWREGSWSARRGYPTAVALHEGRLAHAGRANVFLSVSDDYENFDDSLEGEAAPISRTLGSGPVDVIQYLVSVLRLIAGTTGGEIAIKSSSLDETLTPTNTAANTFSTQGSSTLRAIKLDNKGIFTQRSGRKLFMFGFGISQESYNDYDTVELSLLTPDIMEAGVVSIAIQRQPDTRIHCALADGTVAILTYEPKEEVLAWSRWTTEGAVEQVMVLPGSEEDKVFYHVRRTINGQTKRYLEQWALEEECLGDTGLSWIADCAISYTDTGSNSTITDFAPHLAGEGAVVWGSDTGQDDAGKDFTPDDTGGDQVLITVDTGGDLPMTDSGVHHIVAGLPYSARFKSTKLAYGARGPTAMTMMKRVSALALILHQTHNNALTFGSDSGHLDPMPRTLDEGVEVDDDKIYGSFDKYAMPFNGKWDEDSRVIIEGKAPRPATVMAVLPRVTTNER